MEQILPITLYIPCYNAEPFLDRVLPAVKVQTYPIARTFIVDDGSTDRTAEIAEHHGIEIVRHDVNRGLGAARNTALHAADTEYVACLDADVVPHPDWLERLVPNLRDADFVGASGKLHETVLDTVADRWRDAHMRQSWGDERLEEPDFLYGNNGLYRKDALVGAGLYDEACRTNGEDVTMTAQLREQRKRVVYDPTAECDHLRFDDTPSICRTFWNWHFYDQDWSDPISLRNVRVRAKRHLTRAFLPEDWKARRYELVALDLYMYVNWRWKAWRTHRRARASG